MLRERLSQWYRYNHAINTVREHRLGIAVGATVVAVASAAYWSTIGVDFENNSQQAAANAQAKAEQYYHDNFEPGCITLLKETSVATPATPEEKQRIRQDGRCGEFPWRSLENYQALRNWVQIENDRYVFAQALNAVALGSFAGGAVTGGTFTLVNSSTRRRPYSPRRVQS